MWHLGRRPALDGLRGIAILLVVASHVDGPHLVAGGPVGVTIFFVLSGFLITALLLDERDRTSRISLRAFYGRRARRLLPALALVLLLAGTVQIALGRSPLLLVPPALFFTNWLAAYDQPTGMFQHTWSLSVEEQFYLVWPPVLLLAWARGGRRAVCATALAGVVASVSLRLLLWDAGSGAERVYFGSDTNAAGLLLGCALAAWTTGRPAGRNHPVASLVLIVLTGCLMVGTSVEHYTLTAPLVAMVATAVSIHWLVQDDRVGVFGNRVLRHIGRRSYAWYLWHTPMIIFSQLLGLGTIAGRVLAVVVALGVAEVSWRLVEERFLRRSVPSPTTT